MSTISEPNHDASTQETSAATSESGASKTEVDEPGWTPPDTDPGPDR
jgi:hypothetical protein